ncbi:cathelicidin-1-like [Rhinatrema bivittatum]|uniref:cathelicidin-1-like n=1 Tax=Rhinatrema bivittatum TaxID=194408 RepID=UPI001126602E|nr:cathelicidin-1-like [Rhinatrema bivittatum]
MVLGAVVAALLLAVGSAAAAAAAPLSETRPVPKEVARAAVEAYNQQNEQQAAFKLLRLVLVKRKNFDWGIHFSINFTIKETHCQKTAAYNLQNCKFKEGGLLKDCFAEATVLDFIQDAPLTSVECHQRDVTKQKQSAAPNAKKQRAKTRPQVMSDELKVTIRHFPSSFTAAALTVPSEGKE